MIEEILRRSREAGEYAYNGVALYGHERLPFPADDTGANGARVHNAEIADEPADDELFSSGHTRQKEGAGRRYRGDPAPYGADNPEGAPSAPSVPPAPELWTHESAISSSAPPLSIASPEISAPGTSQQKADIPSSATANNSATPAAFTAAGLEALGNSLELETLRFSSYLGQ